MDKDSLWRELLRKHPAWSETGANFTANGVKQFFDFVWSKAYERGKWVNADIPDIFDNLFKQERN